MKCERCNAVPDRFKLFDYCSRCSQNLCDECMKSSRCPDSSNHKHEPANHGGDES